MIKKYNQFIKESKLQISEEDMNLFSTEPQLQKLISDQKVRLYNKEITFDGNDKQTKEILDQYINKKVTESLDDIVSEELQSAEERWQNRGSSEERWQNRSSGGDLGRAEVNIKGNGLVKRNVVHVVKNALRNIQGEVKIMVDDVTIGIYEGLFSKSKKDPVVKEIEEKISDAAFSLKTFGTTNPGAFVNGAKWAIHNLTNEEIDIIRNNTDKDDFSFFGL